jgi:hypothetical protein
MNEQEVIAFMVQSLNQDNRDICTNNGMAPDEIERSIEQSQASINFMMSNLYNKMKEKNLIV